MLHRITTLLPRALAFSIAVVACASSDASTGDDQDLTASPGGATAADASPDSGRWVTLAPNQCNSNPWNGAKASSEDETSAIQGEGGEVDHFLRGKGIHAVELGFTRSVEPVITCAACQCPRGDTLVVHLAKEEDARRLIAELGFRPLGPNTLGQAPVQCRGNAWQQIVAEDETEQLSRWAAQNGAPGSQVGFLHHTEHRAVCAACQCPRGDRAVVIAEDTTAADKLAALGFERIRM